MKTTTILRALATEAAPIAGHALQAARNPLVREGLLLLGTYVAVDLYRYERRTKTHWTYDKWMRQHNAHRDELDKLRTDLAEQSNLRAQAETRLAQVSGQLGLAGKTDLLAGPDGTPGLAAELLTAAQEHLRRFRHVSAQDPQVPPCTARDYVEAAFDELEQAKDCATSNAPLPA